MTTDDLTRHLAAARAALRQLQFAQARREARRVLAELEAKVAAMMGRNIERAEAGKKFQRGRGKE